jgi:plastocyanin
MKKMLIAAVAVLALVGAAPTVAGTINATVTKAGFVPATLTVKQGDTIVWTNTDTVVHQVVFKNYACSLTIQPGQQGSCTFRTVGKLNFSDPTQKGGKFNGTVTVQAAPASVTLQATKRLITYGAATTLSGIVSNTQPNERVTIAAQPCGATAFSPLATLTTTAGGAYSYAAKPLLTTTFQSKWKNASSPALVVKVRPALRLTRLAATRFAVRVSAAQSFAGKYAYFQRYSTSVSRWVTVRRVTLRSTTLGVAPTVVSRAAFRSRVKRRLRVRVLMPQAQVGACYAPGASNTVRS